MNWSHVGSIEEVSIIGGAKPAVFENTVVVSYSSGKFMHLIIIMVISYGLILQCQKFFNRNIVNDIQSPLTIEDNLVYVPTFSDNFFLFTELKMKEIMEL